MNTFVFESRAVLDGSQTSAMTARTHTTFESRAVLDGSQTHRQHHQPGRRFESRAVLDGSQTPDRTIIRATSLRVVLF